MKLSNFWSQTFFFAVIIFLFASFYQFLQYKNYNLYLINKSLADTAVILIGFSFALSGIAFFTPFLKNVLVYRKQLGVIGFFTGIIHVLITVFFLSRIFPFPSYFLSNPTPFIFSTLTVVLFTIMTVVSNFGIPQKIGGKNWRRILRTGYLGIVFLIFHFGILNFQSWLFWLRNPLSDLPPMTFFLFLFFLFVLILRLFLYLKIKK